MNRALVTGADGFIGRALCTRLSATKVDLYRMVHRQPGPNRIVVDLGRDPVVGLDKIRPDTVFHLAARVHTADIGPTADMEHMRVTVEGTRSLLEAAIESGVRSFVFFGTCAVIPEASNEEMDEEVQPAPMTAYGRAKLEAERLVMGMNGTNGMKTVCLRLPMVYGPGQKGNLARMIHAIECGFFPPLPPFRARRSVVHVDDAVDAAIAVAECDRASGKVFFVAEPHGYTSPEIYELVRRAMGRRVPRWHVPEAILMAMAKAGDLSGRALRRKVPFDSETLDRLSKPALFSSARIHREVGFTTSRNLASTMPQLVNAPMNR